ncbi:hypothetical protein [Streptomyces gobitricini]|uniref:Uncharacterized protein n=1 Tax=Streptomyces gobitricini TaxID=68211 RepID=A0ABN3NAD9_9ACTN
MIGAAVFAGAFAVAFLAFALLVDPRKLWWRFRARHFDNPEAHEPSAASFMWRRVALVVLGVYLGWQAIGMLRLAGVFETGPDRAEVLERVEHAALNLETEAGEGRYKWPGGGEGAWDEFIDPMLRGPERVDPVASLVDHEESGGAWGPGTSRQDGSVPEPGTGSDTGSGAGSGTKGSFVERYDIDGICLTVTATPLPGQSEREYALDNLRYGVTTDVVDSPCE